MNKALVSKKFGIPKEIINQLHGALNKHPHHQGDGLKRCKRLINDRELTYQQIKRLIHDLKYMDKEKNKESYELNGGQAMETWANKALGDARKQIDGQKNSKKRADSIAGLTGIRKNAYLSKHKKDGAAGMIKNIMTGNKELAGGLTPTISEEIKRISEIINKTN